MAMRFCATVLALAGAVLWQLADAEDQACAGAVCDASEDEAAMLQVAHPAKAGKSPGDEDDLSYEGREMLGHNNVIIGKSIFSNVFHSAITFLRGLVEEVLDKDCTAVPHDTLDYLSEVLDFSVLGLGNTTYYPKMYLPNIAKAAKSNLGLLLYNCTAFASFVLNWNDRMDLRIALYEVAISLVPGFTPAVLFFKIAEDTAGAVTEASTKLDGKICADSGQSSSGSGSTPFLQGANSAWKTDTFVAEFIGHTFLAVFLEKGEADNTFVLDLSGDEPAEDAPEMQKLKAKAVSLAPSSLLRARGYLEYKNGQLLIVKVEVYDSEKHKWLAFTPEKSWRVQWSLAKSVLMSLGLFTVECFHTGIHLFSGTVIEAASEALPEQSDLRAMISPQATAAVFALLEQASILHSDHDSSFSGSTWDCNITAIWDLTKEIANFYFNAEPLDILGPGAEQNKWWAGGAKVFVEPITSFAGSMAAALTDEARVRETFAAKLSLVGGYDAASVATTEGLARIYRNMLFVQGICHTHMFATREGLTPLMGWPSTEGMLPRLRGSLIPYIPSVTQQQKTLIVLLFATAAGFNSGFPQMGHGPWPYTEANSALALSITQFQQALDTTRLSIEHYFGNHRGGFVPSYYFTAEAEKPFGYGITQTTYV